MAIFGYFNKVMWEIAFHNLSCGSRREVVQYSLDVKRKELKQTKTELGRRRLFFSVSAGYKIRWRCLKGPNIFRHRNFDRHLFILAYNLVTCIFRLVIYHSWRTCDGGLSRSLCRRWDVVLSNVFHRHIIMSAVNKVKFFCFLNQ